MLGVCREGCGVGYVAHLQRASTVVIVVVVVLHTVSTSPIRACVRPAGVST